jgi:hypothetical protein
MNHLESTGPYRPDDPNATVTLPTQQADGRPMPARIGKFIVEGILGEGAFGTVYLGRDEDLNRCVAIKVPRHERLDLDAYLAEARLVAQLDHPAIVPVYEVGRTADGLPYVVSKFIAGPTLAKRLEAGKLAPVEAATILARAAAALDHAHQRGLVHRDVKPANLLLDDTGLVHVADFGLALTVSDYAGSGQFAGTPAYMSPEQTRGEVSTLDGRSDVFSLGVVLYEMLTGRKPFVGETLFALVQQICEATPLAPHMVNLKVPRELSRIVLRCLAKEATKRFRSASELAQALERWLTVAGARSESRLSPLLPGRFRPFDADAAALYLSLLPAPPAGSTVPEPVRFWKQFVASSSRAGVLSGDPGVGKSSLVRAGLLPRLEPGVNVAFCEAGADDLGPRLLAALAKLDPEAADLDLTGTIRTLRDRLAGRGEKVLLIVDQFERYLHAHPEGEPALREVLRACDGTSVQVLFVVQAEFRGPALHLLHGWGVPALAAPLEGFDPKHAEMVLCRLGQSLGRLPEEDHELTLPQRQFLDQAVGDLLRDGRVSPLELAVLALGFAEIEWEPETYAERGGRSGAWLELLDGVAKRPGGMARGQALSAVLWAFEPYANHKPPSETLPRRDIEAVAKSASLSDAKEVLEILAYELRLMQPIFVPSLQGPGTADGPLRLFLLTPFGAVAAGAWLARNPGAKRHAKARGEKATARKFELTRKVVLALLFTIGVGTLLVFFRHEWEPFLRPIGNVIRDSGWLSLGVGAMLMAVLLGLFGFFGNRKK